MVLFSMSKANAPEFLPPTLPDWHDWLQTHHESGTGVWVLFGKKGSGVESISLPDAIDEAVCFGWIDSVINARDEFTYRIYFSQSNPKSNWSRVNKNKVKRLDEEGRLQPAGLKMIQMAK